MTGIINGSFESPGAGAGEALGWTVSVAPTVPVYADLGGGSAPEGFGTWYPLWDELSDVVVILGEFTGVGGETLDYESFFYGWDISGYSLTYSEANWDENPMQEYYELGWSVAPYHTSWATVPNVSVLADFTAPSGWTVEWSGVSSSSFGAAEDFGGW